LCEYAVPGRFLSKAIPGAARQKTAAERTWDWRVKKREAVVYARGKVTHPDHRPLFLRQWHRVLLNEVRRPTAMGEVVFLD
jgi:hypothetical protein